MVLFLTGRYYTTSEPLEGLCSPVVSAVCPPQPPPQGNRDTCHIPLVHVIILWLEWLEEFQIHYLSATELCRFLPYTEQITHTCTMYMPIQKPMIPPHFPLCLGERRKWYRVCLLSIIAQDWRCCLMHSKVTAAKLMFSLSSVLQKEHFIGKPHVHSYRHTTHRENNTHTHRETVSIRIHFLFISSNGAQWQSTCKTIRVTQSWREHKLPPNNTYTVLTQACVGALVGNVLSPTSRLLQTRTNLTLQ